MRYAVMLGWLSMIGVPLQFPDAAQLVAFTEDQVIVVGAPPVIGSALGRPGG